MEDTPEGAWRSFVAGAICLPAFLALRLLGWGESGVPGDDLFRPLMAEISGYVVAWAGFALVSLPLVQAWGLGGAWPRFICAWNWTNVVQYMVLLLLTVPAALGMAGWAAQGLMLGGVGYALWLEWFVARHALRIEAWRAGALVGLDLAFGLFLGGLIHRLSLG